MELLHVFHSKSFGEISTEVTLLSSKEQVRKQRQEPDPVQSETTEYLTVLLNCREEICQERKKYRNHCLARVMWDFLVVLAAYASVQQKKLGMYCALFDYF